MSSTGILEWATAVSENVLNVQNAMCANIGARMTQCENMTVVDIETIQNVEPKVWEMLPDGIRQIQQAIEHIISYTTPSAVEK